MRRFRPVLPLLIATFFLVGCGDLSDSLLPEDPKDTRLPVPGISAAILDGTTQGNNHFFFLSPLVPNPNYTGIADTDLKPLVTITTESCPPGTPEDLCNPSSPDGGPLATFSVNPNETGAGVSSGSTGYSVVWKTNDYPVVHGGVYRITVELLLPGLGGSGEMMELGWLDVYGVDNQAYNSFKNTYPDRAAISDHGSANITFAILEGLLEQEYCNEGQVEDCDVEIFNYEDEGCLTVFDDPENLGALGTQACVPASSAEIGGNPVEEFVAIMTLEQEGVAQGNWDSGLQVPYLPDIRTIPEGIGFSGGVSMTICQDAQALDEDLHSWLRPFIIVQDPTTGDYEVFLPTEYDFEENLVADDPTYVVLCGDEGDGGLSASRVAANGLGGEPGLLDRVAQGISKATRFLMPKPLHARRRLHGGLNTVVWDISGDDRDDRDEEGDSGADPRSAPSMAGTLETTAPPPSTSEVEYEMGAVLDISMDDSYAVIPSGQLVDSEVTIYVFALNPLEQPFPFEVQVTVTAVSGETSFPATVSFDGSRYTARYTPTVVGTYDITISIDGEELLGDFTNEVKPLSGPLTVSVDVIGDEEWAAEVPEIGLPVYLYDTAGNPVVDSNGDPVGPGETDSNGEVTFEDIIFETYTIHLPKRDFDMDFVKGQEESLMEAMTLSNFVHAQGGEPAEFTAQALEIPETAEIWRVGSGGSGNALQYIKSRRSWFSAQNQVRDNVLHGVSGHLATVNNVDENGSPLVAMNEEENTFIAHFFGTDPNLCPDDPSLKKCRVRAWLGLSDDAVETDFVWVDGGAALWTNWDPDNDPADDRKADSKDHVEIQPDGYWSVINGASSNNDGYFVEWDAEQPDSPSFLPES